MKLQIYLIVGIFLLSIQLTMGQWNEDGNSLYPTNFELVKIGIGTDTPKDRLDVHSNSYNDYGIRWIADDGVDKGAFVRLHSNDGRGRIELGGLSEGTNLDLHYSGDKNWLFRTKNKNINFDLGIGKVGIGTSSPKNKLDVLARNYQDGGIRWRGKWDGVYKYSLLHTNNERGLLNLGSDLPSEDGSKLNSQLQIAHTSGGWQTNTNNENYNLYPRHGNIGVSMLHPAFKLDVNGTSLSLDSFYVARESNYLELYDSQYLGSDEATFKIYIYNNDIVPNTFAWEKDGDVKETGIKIVKGTKQKLEDGITIRFWSDDGKIGDEWFISAKVNNPFAVRNYKGKEAVIVNKYGNVGIGTSSPKAALHIFRKYTLPIPGRNSGRVNLARFETKLITALPISKPRCIMDVWSAPNEAKIGIGVREPSNILTVMKGSPTDPIADDWTIYSSKRWITNINPIESAVDIVNQLNGVTFNWVINDKHDIGLIGEEVGGVIPEVVTYERNGIDAKSISYSRLVPLLIEAIKEQQSQLEAQGEIINSLLSK